MNNITLYCREGSSDKVYQLGLTPKGNGYAVDFAYGRRGSTLNTGTKTPSPIPLEEAQKLFNKLVKEKMAKGYQPADNAPQHASAHITKESSGIHCQLLNTVEEKHLVHLLSLPNFWMQEKFDGRRLLIQKKGTHVTGINRLGFTVALPQPMIESALAYAGDFLIDGEGIGDTLHAFDALFIGLEDLRDLRFATRYFRLRDLLNGFKHPHIQLVDTYCNPEKAERFHRFKAEGKEGVVFKDVDATYTRGRPNAGGSQLKFKFYETASFIVTKVNGKRSVSLILFKGEKVVKAGNVTIPPNHAIPASGSVVECRYLYAFRESGAIYQPVYLGLREDIRADECTTRQLKYKAEVMAVA